MSEHFDGRFWAWFFSSWPRSLAARFSGEPMGRLFNLLELEGNEIVVDIGSGPGFYSLSLAARLPKGRVLALDVAPSMIARLRELAERRGLRDRIQAEVGDAGALPFDDGAADAGISVAALHHMSEPTKCLREAYRVLRAGGRLAVLDWIAPPEDAEATPVNRSGRHRHGPAFLAKDQLLAALAEVGFERIEVEHYKKWALCLSRKPHSQDSAKSVVTAQQ